MKFNERFRSFLPVVVDLETGGVNAEQHALLELSIVLLKWENDRVSPDSVFSWNIEPHPETSVTTQSIELTHIDPSDTERGTVSEETAIRECFRTIRRAVKLAECKRAVLTAHNAHFDHGFIKVAAQRNKIGRNPFHPFTVFDTASMSAVALGHTVLKEAAIRSGFEYDDDAAHSARYDAEITARVFCEIVNRSGYSLDDS